MDMFVVRGGTPLRGRVAVSGAKNAALPIMAAALAADGVTILENVPDLVDVRTLANVLRSLGMTVTRLLDGRLQLCVVDDQPCLAEYDLVRQMRASVCVLGPLLGKRRRACVSLPGGCNIGHRPIDLHLKGLRALGAKITVERGYVIATADQLTGTTIHLAGPFGSTVTGTCNVMTAAVFAEGTTTITAAACEPEVVDLGHFLQGMGAAIDGLGTPVIQIHGPTPLTGGQHRVIPDRIEAATLMIAGAISRGELQLDQLVPEHLTAVIETLRAAGVPVEVSERGLTVAGPQRIRSGAFTALPFPGLPTDVQAQFTALLALADGVSVMTDNVFPDRFMHLPELMRMGADVRREGGSAIIHGVPRLSGACVMASDLRASAALLLAALAAEGESVIRRIYHLDRGYERLETKLNGVGAEIARVVDNLDNLPESLRVDPPEVRPAPHLALDSVAKPTSVRRPE